MTGGVKGSTPTCVIDGCDRPMKAKGWCSVHWQRWWKHGDPLKRLRKANGEGYEHGDGYLASTKNGVTKMAHVEVAEKALGKALPPGAQVHHWDENRKNNANANLLICPSNAYHKLIHQRMRALAACGNASWRKCFYCERYDDPDSPEMEPGGRGFRHVECRRQYSRDWAAQKRKSA